MCWSKLGQKLSFPAVVDVIFAVIGVAVVTDVFVDVEEIEKLRRKLYASPFVFLLLLLLLVLMFLLTLMLVRKLKNFVENVKHHHSFPSLTWSAMISYYY